jgi:NTP pyrophosphatase (non-canonical NTP hydrolase)
MPHSDFFTVTPGTVLGKSRARSHDAEHQVLPDVTMTNDPKPFAPLVDLKGLQQAQLAFARERDWIRFHSPKNLAMALTGEVGELVELFQWLDQDASYRVAESPATARAVRDELADVLIYLAHLAAVLGVDLDEAVRTKLASNARKYPAPDDPPGSA